MPRDAFQIQKLYCQPGIQACSSNIDEKMGKKISSIRICLLLLKERELSLGDFFIIHSLVC